MLLIDKHMSTAKYAPASLGSDTVSPILEPDNLSFLQQGVGISLGQGSYSKAPIGGQHYVPPYVNCYWIHQGSGMSAEAIAVFFKGHWEQGAPPVLGGPVDQQGTQRIDGGQLHSPGNSFWGDLGQLTTCAGIGTLAGVGLVSAGAATTAEGAVVGWGTAAGSIMAGVKEIGQCFTILNQGLCNAYQSPFTAMDDCGTIGDKIDPSANTGNTSYSDPVVNLDFNGQDFGQQWNFGDVMNGGYGGGGGLKWTPENQNQNCGASPLSLSHIDINICGAAAGCEYTPFTDYVHV